MRLAIADLRRCLSRDCALFLLCCAVLMASSSACDGDDAPAVPSSQLRVMVYSDLQAGRDIARLELSLWDVGEREEFHREVVDLQGAAAGPFPVSSTLSGEPDTDFVLRVEGYTPDDWNGLDEAVLVQQKVRARFLSQDTGIVQIFLHSACMRADCPAGLSCDPPTAATGVVDACVPTVTVGELQRVNVGESNAVSLDETVIGYPESPCLRETGLCNDGDVCNGIEHCRPRHPEADARGCIPGVPPPCDLDVCASTELCGALKHCTTHEECDDGRVCNGEERCEPGNGNTDLRGCLPGERIECEAGTSCREPDGLCLDCQEAGDEDQDGVNSVLCGGDDCDDSSKTVYPGAPELCDGLDNDCDRNVDSPLADDACPAAPAAPGGLEGACVEGRCELRCVDPAFIPDPDPATQQCVPVSCENDATLACDDGRHCNGAERCEPGAEGADARGCLSGEMVACAPDQICIEEADRGVCSACAVDDDSDDDGHAAVACGGDDCDDGDRDRFPGQTERCDGLDNDCDDEIDEGATDSCTVPQVGSSACRSAACRIECPDNFEVNGAGDNCTAIDRCIGITACDPGICSSEGTGYRCECPATFVATGGTRCECPVGARLTSDGKGCNSPAFGNKVQLSQDGAPVGDRGRPIMTDTFDDSLMLVWTVENESLRSTQLWARSHRAGGGFGAVAFSGQSFERLSGLQAVKLNGGQGRVAFLGALSGSEQRSDEVFLVDIGAGGLSAPTRYMPAGIDRRAELSSLRMASDGQSQTALAFYVRQGTDGDTSTTRYVDYLPPPAAWTGPQALGAANGGDGMSLTMDESGRALLAFPGGYFTAAGGAFSAQQASADVRLPVGMAPTGQAVGGDGELGLFDFNSGWQGAGAIGRVGSTEARVFDNGDVLAVWAEGPQLYFRRYDVPGRSWSDRAVVPGSAKGDVSLLSLSVHGAEALLASVDASGEVRAQRYVDGLWLDAMSLATVAVDSMPSWVGAGLYSRGQGVVAFTEGPAGRRALVAFEMD